jgi:hypothetical protein
VAVDQCGYAVTGGDAATVEHYDTAVRSLLLFADDVGDAWEATVAEDPGFALGHIGRAYLLCLSSEGADAKRARAILDDLDGSRLGDRERRHLGAARSYAHGDLRGASERLGALTVEYPLDALALAVGHQLDFFRGDATGLRDRIGRALLAWGASHPLFGFVIGMHAFGLEECNLYPEAEAAGMRALHLERRDVWALHAVVHVHEMQGRFVSGLQLMDEHRREWTNGNFFVVHNAWHETLFHLEAGDVDAALAIYDSTIRPPGSTNVALEMLDASALLWRLHLEGIDVGQRWLELADAWRAVTDDPWYSFNDAHAAMTFAAAGRLDDARSLVDRLRTYIEREPPIASNVAMTAEVGLPVCAAILAFAEERYGDVVELLHPIRSVVHHFGGSNAQRDAIARTLLEACIRDGQHNLARALVSERLTLKPASPYNQRQLARLLEPTNDKELPCLST